MTRKAPPKPKTDNKLSKIEAAMKRWTSKRKRAETALKKLKKQQAYYLKKQAIN